MDDGSMALTEVVEWARSVALVRLALALVRVILLDRRIPLMPHNQAVLAIF
jgi:hypothetical protein